MWTIYEGDRDFFYGDAYDGRSSYAYGAGPHGYERHPHGYTHHSHSLGNPSMEHSYYGHPYASTYSVDVPSLSPMVELRVPVHSERARRSLIKKLGKLHGVTSVDVDIHSQRVTVTGNVTPAEVLRTARKKESRAQMWMGDSPYTSSHQSIPGHSSGGYSSVPSWNGMVYTN